MSDAEMEELIQTIDREEREPYLAGRLFENSTEQYDLRPPATGQEISDCEQFLGRSFSPSYHHFLRLHDGWRGFYPNTGDGYLYGTYHLRYEAAARESFSLTVWADLQASRPSDPYMTAVPAYPNDLYLPENFYRFLDTMEPVPQEMQAVKALLGDPEVQEYLSELTQTLLGGETHYRLFLDTKTLRADGEMEVVEWSDSNESRWPDFYEFLRDRADRYR